MKQKVLSLCFPTYNRGWCMKEQIERLKSCPKDVLDRMEIIISDNCSTDDTQQIVEDAIADGFVCRYIRNETNLGMDGNFVSCFRKAQGRYVWLLGDDDYIVVDSLGEIIYYLDKDEEFGLLHIYSKPKRSKSGFVKYTNFDDCLKETSYNITFISANIVNTRYVQTVDFSRYMGTWFTLMPVYINALRGEHNNIVYYEVSFDGGYDKARNGGYNYFNVFVQNYQNIWNEYYQMHLITASEFAFLKKDIWPIIFGGIRSLMFRRDKNNYRRERAWHILLKYYGNEWYFWWTFIKYPFELLKRKISKKHK